jgi:hypothetical protein
MSAPRLWIGCMLAVLLGLLAVGAIGGTPLRHFVQVVPGAAVLGLAARRTRWAADAAAPIFAVWFVLMAWIWLYLLGLSRVITGTFSAGRRR